MEKQEKNNIRLGLFVFAGLITLILALYTIGKNRSLFGADFKLKVHFTNLNGLVEGNNVLFSGIQAGSVKKIDLINDTTIEVTLLINNKLKNYIHKNAMAYVSTEGLMGNKIINIIPVKGTSSKVEDGDLLITQKMASTDEMLQTLSKTNHNIAVISEALKNTVLRINNSKVLDLLDNSQISNDLRSSLRNFRQVSSHADQLTAHINEIVTRTKEGKGAAGILLTDTASESNLRETLLKIRSAGDQANRLLIRLNDLIAGINQDMTNGNGIANLLLKDSAAANSLKLGIDHANKGADGFNQNMEALKHNFLFRGYFKKQKKNKSKKLETINPDKQ
ncbi:MAG TPA: MlaD family protein [Pedobacter sp.]